MTEADSPAPRESFEAFRTRFVTALDRAQWTAVADLTRLPFLYEGEPRDRAQFAGIAPALFSAEVRACLRKAPPAPEDDRIVLWCAPYGFYFEHASAGWRLAEFIADGEA